MVSLSSRPWVWVDQPDAFQRMLVELRQSPVLGVDTEANSLYAYRERVCLIQLSSEQADYLVDPLTLQDLEGLGAIFADEHTQKVFHAGEFDLLGLKRDFGFRFENLFDTMIAAMLLGYERWGLADVLSAELGIELDKRYQKADWGRRPVQEAMKDYARLDSAYLIPLSRRLTEKLQASPRWPLALEDFHRLQAVQPAEKEKNAASFWHVLGNHDLDAAQAHILLELIDYRDRQARERNVPLFRVLSDELLVQVAQFVPRNEQELSAVPGMSAALARSHAGGILAAVRTGWEAQGEPLPRRTPSDEAYLARLHALQVWRKQEAERLHLHASLVLPRDVMERIAHSNPASEGELGPLMADVPYRFARLSDGILSALRALEPAI
jgi:ribonuclease D